MAAKSYRKKYPSKQKSNSISKWVIRFFVFVFIFFVLLGIYKFRDGFLYYLGFKTDKYSHELSADERKLA